MERILRYFFVIALALGATECPGMTTRTGQLAKYVDPQSYAYMYPYLSNQMRTELNPGTTVSMANNPIDVIVKTEPLSEPRRVVPRTRKTATTTSTARAATTNNSVQKTVQPRRTVAARPTSTGRNGATTVAARSAVKPVARAVGSGTVEASTNTGVSYNRCLADYSQCMDGYCARESAAYNRCYCSAKLAQIDAQYQNPISDLMLQIVRLQSGGTSIWTEEEMNEYWMQVVGNNVGTNSWVDLENALNIQWPTSEERVRGQQVFLTGHSYCLQHLRACAPMASNMRDSYRSKIARDCQSYENTLIKIKTAAETVIENYRE